MNRLRIENFKCFDDVEVALRPLTVLSGINGMGKSSFMQSLLLLRQSVLASPDSPKARLNGPLVCLGFADDVLYDNARTDEPIRFTLQHQHQDQATVSFSYAYSKGARILDPAGAIPEIGELPLFGKDFYYLQAERIGPRTSFDSGEPDCLYNRIGNAGEYCAWLLSEYERKPIGCDCLLHEKESINELRLQVEAWLSEIGQTPRIHLDDHRAMDRVSMQFSFIRDGIPSGNYRPTNVGFGLTYALPIFVSALIAEPKGILLIENPEAHLHPKGQSAMGLFLARAAAGGVQVLVETHSDHLLNGIRIAAKRQIIDAEDVALHFFQREKDAQSTSVVTPRLDQNGRLDQWPEGFFDEWENGLAELL